MKKAMKHLPTIIFLVFIYTMAILFFVLPKSDYSSSEKRYLEKFPKLTADTFFSGDFGADFETYLADHTAGRKFYVGLNSYYHLGLGNPLSNGIYHCKNGYLVNDPPVTDQFDRNVKIVSEFASLNNVETSFLLAPSTGYITNDILPNNHIHYNDDALFANAAAKFKDAGVNFIDVRDTFKNEYKAGKQIYYKTDHHWTTEGAFTAYKSLAATLGFKSFDKSDYTIKTENNFYGTTYSSSGFWCAEPDTIEMWSNKENYKINVTIKDRNKDNQKITINNDSVFFTERLKEDDKYPVFLDGNHPYTVINNESLKEKGNDKKLLVIKDSFAHSLVPFLSDHYSQIIMIDMRYYRQNINEGTLSVADLIKTNNIDQVLFIYSLDNFATDAENLIHTIM